jgi:integrase
MPRVTREPLTPDQIRKQQPGAAPIDLRDGLARGLILTVLPSGRRQWSVRYVYKGKHRRLPLGDWPTLTLAKAREAARDERTKIRNGQDPAADRAAAKAKRTDTIAALVTAYLDEHAKPHKRSAAEDERVLTVDVLPYWRDKAVRELTRQDIKARLRAILKRGAPIAANRTLAVIRKMLNYAVDEEWIDANPAARIKRLAPEVSRERVLTDDELRALWRCLSNLPTTAEKPAPGRPSRRREKRDEDPLCPVSAPLAAALKVRLLTAQRGGEVARMRWEDLDLLAGWWTIPGSDTKNGEAHRVPLTSDVLEIVKAQRHDDEQDEDEEPEGYVFSALGGGSVAARSKKAAAQLSKVLKFDFRGHDLRRTAATRMAAAGVPSAHISHVLNHVQGGARATRVYDRHSYDREKRTALETWQRELRRVLAAELKAGADVVSIESRRA